MTRNEITAHKAASTRALKALRKNASQNKSAAAVLRRRQREADLMFPDQNREQRAGLLSALRSQYRAIRQQVARRASLDLERTP
jgi:hypothetical protein